MPKYECVVNVTAGKHEGQKKVIEVYAPSVHEVGDYIRNKAFSLLYAGRIEETFEDFENEEQDAEELELVLED